MFPSSNAKELCNYMCHDFLFFSILVTEWFSAEDIPAGFHLQSRQAISDVSMF